MKIMKPKFLLLAAIVIAAFASCKKERTKGNQTSNGVPGTSKVATDGGGLRHTGGEGRRSSWSLLYQRILGNDTKTILWQPS